MTKLRPCDGRPWLWECVVNVTEKARFRNIPGVAWDGLHSVLIVPDEVLKWLEQRN